ncbi:DUF6527 family protein [Novilysobacter spongiicola]|uniref:DUF6527 family protein n=1 Tax=Novilysobacter spongiicola TaxID=435289 RepID=UPI003CCCB734
MHILTALRRACIWITGWWRYDLKIVEVNGDELPALIEKKTLVRMMDEGMEWSAAMLCPCGCGEVIELTLSRDVKPRWDLRGSRRKPTLHPSVWRNVGCRSHFWVRGGRVIWVGSRRA